MTSAAFAATGVVDFGATRLPGSGLELGKACTIQRIQIESAEKLRAPHIDQAASQIGWSLIARYVDGGIRPENAPDGTRSVWPDYRGQVGAYSVEISNLISLGNTGTISGGTIKYTNERGSSIHCQFAPGNVSVTFNGLDMKSGVAVSDTEAMGKRLLALGKEFLLTAEVDTPRAQVKKSSQQLQEAIEAF